MISALRQKSNFEFQTFLKKIKIFGFPLCSTREDLSIDASITNVGLILTKLRSFQLFVKSQISNFFGKKFKFFGFHCVVLVKTFPLMYQITNVELILTKLRGFLFSGCGQTDGRTDTVLESSYGNMSAHKKFQLKAQN